MARDDTHKLHFVSSSIQKQVQEMPWRAVLADWLFFFFQRYLKDNSEFRTCATAFEVSTVMRLKYLMCSEKPKQYSSLTFTATAKLCFVHAILIKYTADG